MPYQLSFQVSTQDSFEHTIQRVTEALKLDGFGVLTQIDVGATLKEKLNEEFRPYVILGACNPPLAHRGLQAESQVGLLLPCNVTVEATAEGTLISIINPEAMLGVGHLKNNEIVRQVAREARVRLERVAERLNS